MNERKGRVQGKWLQDALDVQGLSVLKVATMLGYKRGDKFYYHINDRSYLNAESLSQLAKEFPRINLHYVLTGEGSPLL